MLTGMLLKSLFSDNMATILVTGGTGLVGRALTRELTAQGHQCIVISRKPAPAKGGIRFAAWDPEAGTLDETSLLEADYIIHLAGAGVADKRWSPARKKEIRDSRVKSGQLLAQKLTQLPHKVKALISASATAQDDRKDKPTIVQIAADAGTFHTLVAAVKAAGLAETLSGPGPFTVFAPTDAAFAKLPPDLVSYLLKPENKEKLKAILTYHVVSGAVYEKDVKAGDVKTVQGDNITIGTNGGVTINDCVLHIAQSALPFGGIGPSGMGPWL